ncbi:MAG: permease-like cell division protein FtsX [Alistipes sp.]
MKEDKRLKRKIRNSYIVSTISVALVLFLLGSVGYLMTAALQVATTLQESVNVSVELRNGLDSARVAKIHEQICDSEIVSEATFSSKEEKINDGEFRKMFENEIDEILGENPLMDSYEVKLSARSSEHELLEKFITQIEEIRGVDRVSYPAQMVERLHATVGKIRLVLTIFGGALLIISLILLNNTIRLAIFSKRYLINTMKLVGATKWYIMRPFLQSSITQGILAGLGAMLLFGIAIYGLNEAIPELTSLATMSKIVLITFAMMAGGVLISASFTIFAVNKFVNMKSNKIHLY